MTTIEYFRRLDVRVGRVLKAEDFPEARTPAYKLTIDFGEGIGTRHSSAQLTKAHTKEELLGKKVLCVTNLPPLQIGPFTSEVLTLGVPDKEGNWVIITPDKDVPLGGRLA